MSYEERVVVRETGTGAASAEVTEQRRRVAVRPTWATLASRVVVAGFLVVQVVILLRIVLLALDAREGAALTQIVLDLSRVFVAPFEGVLRTDALRAGGSVLDVAAVVALVVWTLVELLILGVLRIGRSGDEV